jgi:hypothetical protein
VSLHEPAGGACGRFSGGQCSGGGDRFHSNLASTVSGLIPIPKREGTQAGLVVARV